VEENIWFTPKKIRNLMSGRHVYKAKKMYNINVIIHTIWIIFFILVYVVLK